MQDHERIEGVNPMPEPVEQGGSLSAHGVSKETIVKLRTGIQEKKTPNPNAEVLLRKLEKGELEVFDGESVRLLQKVLKDNNARTILSKLSGALGPTLYPIFEFAVSKFAGYEGAIHAASYGKEHVGHKVHEYLGKKLLEPLIIDEHGWFESLKHTINEGTKTVLNPLIDSASHTAGNVAEIPYAAAGFLAASALVGGGVRLYREIKKTKGFEQIGDVIEKSEEMIKTGKKDEDGIDPRLTLLALQKKILEDRKNIGHKLSNEEWLALAVAVREAKISLLREQTKGPKIQAAPGMKESFEIQSRVVESIVKTEESISDADRELALVILTELDQNLAGERGPSDKRLKNYNSLANKSGRYVKAFAGGAIDGTGIPFLYRTTKGALKLAGKVIKPF